jgi:hypothetical protein
MPLYSFPISLVRPFRLLRTSLNSAGFSRWLAFAVIGAVLSTAPARAVDRKLTLTAPATAVAGSTVWFTASASTDAKDAEQIGFFHVEYSVDGGKTWTGACYDTTVGKSASRSASFTAGAAGSTAFARVRIAYRGGVGDVDYAGKPIAWDGSWKNWLQPPAKVVAISITAPAKK